MSTFRTIAEIKAANTAGGFFFFTPGAMRFFNSRVLRGVIGDRFFVTSERYVPSDGVPEARLYTVRRCNDDGSVDDVGGFQEHGSPAAAEAE